MTKQTKIVERLAKKWQYGMPDSFGAAGSEVSVKDTRWWLNAIADELDRGEEESWKDAPCSQALPFSASWLRTKAESESP